MKTYCNKTDSKYTEVIDGASICRLPKRNQKKRVIFALLADFGAPYGKGLEIKAVIDAAKQENIEYIGIVRGNGNGKDLVTALPFGNVFFRALVFIEKYICKTFPSRYWQQKLFDFAVSWRIKRTDADVLWAGPLMPNTFKIAKQKGMQTYLHAVELSAAYNKEVLASLYPDKNDQPTIWSDRYLKMSESTYSNVDYVLTHTTFAKESYEKQGFKAETVKRIDFGPGNTLVDGNLVIREKPNSPFRCLFVGNFVKMKGAHILLEAFGTLNESEFELHVCGDIYPELKLQAQEAKRGNIFFHGYQNPKTFYENCDVLIFPTLSESAGRVVTEASILKLPIICTPAGTHSIILNNSSGKVIEPEPHDLKLAIIEARNNYQKFQIFAEHACELASQLSWARFGRTNLQIIKENRKDRNDKDCNS